MKGGGRRCSVLDVTGKIPIASHKHNRRTTSNSCSLLDVVCMCVYICIYIHIITICVCVCVYVCMYVYMYIYIRIYI